MGNYIFNENGHLSYIDDIIRYLSIQIEKEDVIKTYISNLFWDKYNRLLDYSIKQGFFNGDLYESGNTATNTIGVIEEYLKTVFECTENEIKKFKETAESLLEKDIEGYNEIKEVI